MFNGSETTIFMYSCTRPWGDHVRYDDIPSVNDRAFMAERTGQPMFLNDDEFTLV